MSHRYVHLRFAHLQSLHNLSPVIWLYMKRGNTRTKRENVAVLETSIGLFVVKPLRANRI